MTEQITDFKITLVQASLIWENPSANQTHLQELLSRSTDQTDLIILPEMFSTGFSMNTAMAEREGGLSAQWMMELARAKNAAVVGSIMTSSKEGKYFNRLHWVTPEGTIKTYDKKHLFSFANEHEHYTAGTDRLIVEHRGWRICPLVCYDLRFPVWSRNQDLRDGQGPVFDMLIYVANWPKARTQAWSNLLEARAHENQVYTCGVNRVGKDANDMEYNGNSAVFSPKGELLCQFQAGEEAVKTVSLSFETLQKFRDKFPVAEDRDAFSLIDLQDD